MNYQWLFLPFPILLSEAASDTPPPPHPLTHYLQAVIRAYCLCFKVICHSKINMANIKNGNVELKMTTQFKLPE